MGSGKGRSSPTSPVEGDDHDANAHAPRRSSLAQHHALRLPQPGDLIASTFTSPIDPLYLAAIFDPIFTASYPHTRQVQRISLPEAIYRAFQRPQEQAPPASRLVDVASLLRDHPDRIIVVFPECTTTNGRGILPFSPSLLTAPKGAKIFPVCLRYTPSDITTPIPGSYWQFLWDFLSRPSHCIRVRIAECVFNIVKSSSSTNHNTYTSNYLDLMQDKESSMASNTETLLGSADECGREAPSAEERKVLDKVAEDLARLGRVRRVGLGVRDKVAFLEVWSRHRHRRR